MLTTNEFENLLDRPESSVLDFKKNMYDFTNDVALIKTANFIKDVMSFCNTIRNETSYIIFGIEEFSDKSKAYHGVDIDIDDAILQNKIKDKLYPRPRFSYYSLPFKELKFGVLEFPITKYSIPISSTIKMKGLEVGKVYYRQGTSNTEAQGLEVIKINDWLRSLPEANNTSNEIEEVAKLIKDLTNTQIQLSFSISEIYRIAKRLKHQPLLRFCINELKGLNSTDERGDESELEYRIQKVFIAPFQVEVHPIATASMIKNEFSKNENVHEYKFLFSQSITSLEEMLKNFATKPDTTLATISMSSKDVFDNRVKTDFPVYAYVFHDTITSIYSSIRQKAIDLLMST